MTMRPSGESVPALVVTVAQPDAGLVLSGALPVLSVRHRLPADVSYRCPSGHKIDAYLSRRQCGRCGQSAEPIIALLYASGHLPVGAPPWQDPQPSVTALSGVVLARLILTNSHHQNYCPADPRADVGPYGPLCHGLARPSHWHHTVGEVSPLSEPVPVAPVVACPGTSPPATRHRLLDPSCQLCVGNSPTWWRTDCPSSGE